MLMQASGDRPKPPAAGMGRKKGVPNKITADIKAMILGALEAKGGQAYLEEQAEKNPIAFMGLLAKVMPTQVSADPDNPLFPKKIEIVVVDAKKQI